jgi:hypothetical protein
MKKLFITFASIASLLCAANAQPANDEPCNAVLLTVIPDVDECTPNVPIQWTAATATNLPNPNCAAGQLLDVWYKFVAPANGKVNIRVNTVNPGANDGVMALYNGNNCNSPGSAIDCNDDGGIFGISPALTLTGLTAGQTYFLRLWNFLSAGGNFTICLSTPEIPPPPIDPTKKVGIGTTAPQANLDLNGNLIVRGGNPGAGKVLTAVDNKGTTEWKTQGSGKPAFKICLSTNQPITTYNTEYPVSFKTVMYDVASNFNTTDSSIILNDVPGSIYHFDINLIYSYITNYNGGFQKRAYIRVYQNGNILHEFPSGVMIDLTNYYPHGAGFDLQTLSNSDKITISVGFFWAGGSIISSSQYGTPPAIKNSCISGFKIN